MTDTIDYNKVGWRRGNATPEGIRWHEWKLGPPERPVDRGSVWEELQTVPGSSKLKKSSFYLYAMSNALIHFVERLPHYIVTGQRGWQLTDKNIWVCDGTDFSFRFVIEEPSWVYVPTGNTDPWTERRTS